MRKFFKVLHQSKKSKARVGEIKTAHGVIKTPAFVPVGTKGTIKSIPPSFLRQIGVQVAFVNTYHLVTHPGVEVIEKAGGIHRYSGLNIPLMSDSGGFQIFSLSRKRQNLKFNSQDDEKLKMIKISEDGVKFRSPFDGSPIEFTPEKSMEYQQMIGADINMAFDECIYYPAGYQYTKKATERTHRWLLRSLKWKKSEIRNSKFETLKQNKFALGQANPNVLNSNNQNVSNFDIRASNLPQYLYGVIQGGVFEDLRRKSAQFVVSQPVDGIAIGGVSVGETKKEMREQVAWVSDYLPVDRPVHLLGVGQIDDIVDLVKYGIDSFDCVEPTRLARMGTVYQNDKEKYKMGKIDILKGKYREDLSPVDNNCSCFVCQNFTKSYLHHLFKNRELLAYTLATYHNLWVMERFFEKIRELISGDLI